MDESNEKENWYLGIFYYNRINKSIFVPKRIGIGWTLNFARWQSILVLTLLLMLIAFTILKPVL